MCSGNISPARNVLHTLGWATLGAVIGAAIMLAWVSSSLGPAQP